MRKISFWARRHKQVARISIVTIFILLDVIGIFAGNLLNDLRISFSTTVLSGIVAILILAVFLYPSKREKGKTIRPQDHYVKQKTCDFILAAAGFGIALFLGNRPDKLFFDASFLHATALTSPASVKDSSKSYKTIRDFSASMKDKNGNLLRWKERKKLLKEQIRGIKRSNDLSDGDKTALLIVSIVVALGLLYLVAALACNLSCNGSDAAALLVGIGGGALVIFLLVITIRAIYKGKRKKSAIATPSPNGG